MKKISAYTLMYLVLMLVPLATTAKAAEYCGGAHISSGGCAAQWCNECYAGTCGNTYEKIIHCPGDPLPVYP